MRFTLPVFISAKNIMVIMEVSIATAHRRLRLYKDAKTIANYKKVLLVDFLRFYEIDIQIAYQKLLNQSN